MIPTNDRLEFLQKLKASGTNLTEWEAGFVDSHVHSGTFTSAEKLVIDHLKLRYGKRVLK